MNRFTKIFFPILITDYRSLITSLLLTPISLLLFSCNSTEPVTNESLYVAAIDASCTEVWLEIKTENITLPTKINLLLDGELVGIISLMDKDTVFIHRSLQPSTTYNYQVSKNGLKSNLVTFTTLDTTSSNYIWEKYYFGNIGSSLLRDVAIIDESNIWAVGDILLQDNSGDYKTYALAKWDGISWELEQVEFAHYPETSKRPGKLNAIFMLDKENIFVATASQLLKWENNSWKQKAQFATAIPFYGQVKEIWGNAEDNIYCVGKNGTIYHYYGTGWRKLDTGTDLDIQDIWGDYDEYKDEWEILAVASNKYENSGNKLLKLDGEKVIEISTSPIQWSVFSCWFILNREYILAGSGIYEKKDLNEISWANNVLDISNYTIFKVRGELINNLVAVGGFGDVQHYNGVKWRSHYETTQISGNYRSVAIVKNIVVTVGQHNTQAVITIGRK